MAAHRELITRALAELGRRPCFELRSVISRLDEVDRRLKPVIETMMREPLFPIGIDMFQADVAFRDFRAGEAIAPGGGMWSGCGEGPAVCACAVAASASRQAAPIPRALTGRRTS